MVLNMLKKNHLDDLTKAYDDSSPGSFDNSIVLNWYPDRIMDITTGESLLELGLGHGITIMRFWKRFKRHLVIEGSKNIISRFKENHPECTVNIKHTFFEEFESEERFDLIVMGFILEHVDDPSGILCKYKEYLEPGGSVFIAAPNGEALNRRLGHEAGMLPNMMQLGEADLAIGHKRLYNLDKLRELVHLSEYRIKRTEGIFLKPLSTMQLQSLGLSESVIQAMLKVGISYPELSVGILMEIEPSL